MVTTTAPFGMVEAPLDAVLMFLAYRCSFVARGFTSDVKQLVELFKAAVDHKGFSIIHLLSPCVTFNKTVTADFLKERVAHIPEDHDPGDIGKAFQLALDKEKIYTGIFFKEDRPAMHDNLEIIKTRAQEKEPGTLREIFERFI